MRKREAVAVGHVVNLPHQAARRADVDRLLEAPISSTTDYADGHG
jgi:hypothetical protein